MTSLQVGYGGLILIDTQSVALIKAVRVHPDYQGQGIMTKINKTGELFLRRRLGHSFHVRVAQIYTPKLHLSDNTHTNPEYRIRDEWVGDVIDGKRRFYSDTGRSHADLENSCFAFGKLQSGCK